MGMGCKKQVARMRDDPTAAGANTLPLGGSVGLELLEKD